MLRLRVGDPVLAVDQLRGLIVARREVWYELREFGDEFNQMRSEHKITTFPPGTRLSAGPPDVTRNRGSGQIHVPSPPNGDE